MENVENDRFGNILNPSFTSGAASVRFENGIELFTYSGLKKDDPLVSRAFAKDEEFQKLRGHIINNTLFIEERIDHVIAKIIFKKDRSNIRLFFSIILGREFFTLMNKWKVLRDLFNSVSPYKDRDYSELKTNLKRIIEIRDRFAHGQVSYSDFNAEKIFLEYFDGEVKKEEIKDVDMRDFISLIHRCQKELDEIIQELDTNELDKVISQIESSLN